MCVPERYKPGTLYPQQGQVDETIIFIVTTARTSNNSALIITLKMNHYQVKGATVKEGFAVTYLTGKPPLFDLIFLFISSLKNISKKFKVDLACFQIFH
jgi:hypothetical protein